MDKVPRIEVAKYCLRSELGRIFRITTGQYGAEPDLSNMSDRAIMELFEGPSVCYRLNSIYWRVADERYQWRLESIKSERIHLTGLGLNNITKLIYSPKINNDPIKLKAYLLDYFSRHKYDDPEQLNELRLHSAHPYPRVYCCLYTVKRKDLCCLRVS